MRLSYKFFTYWPLVCAIKIILASWNELTDIFSQCFEDISLSPDTLLADRKLPSVQISFFSLWNLLRFSLCLRCYCISQNAVEVYIFYFLLRNWYAPSNYGLLMPSVWNILGHYFFTYSSWLISLFSPSRISARVSVNVCLTLSSPCRSTSLSYFSFFFRLSGPCCGLFPQICLPSHWFSFQLCSVCC